MTSEPQRSHPSLSIIIPNFNYGRFVEDAIRSALDLRWAQKEIIVVDDGSTDDSWARIIRCCDQGVKGIRQTNAGQLVACQTGFAQATGDLVLFLDSDNLIAPDLMEEVAPRYRPGVSKIQVRMYVVDAEGCPTGSEYPKFPRGISPTLIRDWVRGSSAYPTPPRFGNIYSREFLAKILPVDDAHDRAADSYCLAAAPQLGDIETVDKPLVAYRVHGANDGAMTQLQSGKFAVELRRASWRADFARRFCKNSRDTPPDPIRNSIPVLLQRASSFRLRPEDHPLLGDNRWKIARDFAKASFNDHHFSAKTVLLLGAWTVGILVLPQPLAERLVSWRFAPASRPTFLKRLVDRA